MSMFRPSHGESPWLASSFRFTRSTTGVMALPCYFLSGRPWYSQSSFSFHLVRPAPLPGYPLTVSLPFHFFALLLTHPTLHFSTPHDPPCTLPRCRTDCTPVSSLLTDIPRDAQWLADHKSCPRASARRNPHNSLAETWLSLPGVGGEPCVYFSRVEARPRLFQTCCSRVHGWRTKRWGIFVGGSDGFVG